MRFNLKALNPLRWYRGIPGEIQFFLFAAYVLICVWLWLAFDELLP